MDIVCQHCNKTIHLQQKYPYHAGFSNRGFLYCDSCPAVFLFSSFDEQYTQIAGDNHPWTLDDKQKRRVEKNIKPCKCGGQFLFDAYPRCPFCMGDISSLLPDNMHFLEIGTVVDADKDSSVWRIKDKS